MNEKALGLTGLLPPDITTLDAQVKRAYVQYERLPDALSKNIYLTALHDRNEVLFFRVLSEHVREMIPIVNDLTVGIAMEQYHLSAAALGASIFQSIMPTGLQKLSRISLSGPATSASCIATDAEQIVGIGGWGIGGIEVSIGKLAIYTAAGGIDPARVIPVMLDVGTNHASLLEDPKYVGSRHPRIRGERYDSLLESYIKAVTNLVANTVLQWEDFEPAMEDASWRNTATGSACSTTTCRAPERSRSRLPCPPSESAERSCVTSGWSSSEPERPASALPIRSAMRSFARESRRKMQRHVSGAWIAAAYSRLTRRISGIPACVRSSGRGKQ
jgi:hypothetical protein